MLGAIYIGMSGMNAYSKGLQTISNNVANMNSPGYKASTVNFRDVFYLGANGSSYTNGMLGRGGGGGVRFGEPSIDFSQGDPRQTENDLDLAISGNGFFVLRDGDRTAYARTGQFTVDEEGFIKLSETKYNLSIIDGARQPVAANIDSKRIYQAVATKKITFSDRLYRDATDPPKVGNIVVYASDGSKHVWEVTFTKGTGPLSNEWQVTVKENGSVIASPILPIKFDLAGNIDPTTSSIVVTTPVAGAETLSVTLDFSKLAVAIGGTTSTVSATSDGNATGNLTKVSVDVDGKIILTYSNTKTQTLGSVALADFRDPQALDRVGGGLFENQANAQFRLLESGKDGIGKVLSKQLEASNVNLSDEFGQLILIQRGFQASSQVVSASNDMIQQLFGIRGQG